MAKDQSWRAPTRLCWAPASSAPRSRCISPSAGLRVALIDRRGAGRGDLLRQCRGDRRQYGVSAGLSRRAVERCCGSRSSSATGGELPPAFLPQVAPWLLAFRANSRPERLETAPRDAAAVCARGCRARGADGRSPARRGICARKAGSSSIAATQPSRRPRASARSPASSAFRHQRSIREGARRSSRRWRRCFATACTGQAPRA